MYALIRYDTEGRREDLDGFFEQIIKVHRQDDIPATFFCTGKALETRSDEFTDFNAEVRSDPLFDLQDHSYSHIGVCYEAGNDVETLRDDYIKSFEAHRRVLGKAPIGVSLCGTSGRDGRCLEGFDCTEKSRQEFEMLVSLGVKMINTKLIGYDEKHDFINYAKLGHPEVMGYISGFGDTGWFRDKPYDEAMGFILEAISTHAKLGKHIPILLHDWCAYNFAPDRSLDHVRRIAEHARNCGYELRTHMDCYNDKPLWQG